MWCSTGWIGFINISTGSILSYIPSWRVQICCTVNGSADDGRSYIPSWRVQICCTVNGPAHDGSKRHSIQTPNDTAYKLGGLLQRIQTAVQIVLKPPAPAMGPIYPFWTSRSCGPAGWIALLLIKAGDVETNPGPTTTHKQIWICDMCHKQIHVRKQISIRCNRIEHCVHLRCAGIRQEQYTDTWTCHLHR